MDNVLLKGSFLTKTISSLVSVVVLLFIIGGLPPIPSIVLYASYVVAAIFFIFSPSISFIPSYIFFLSYIGLSIPFKNISFVFHSQERFFLFALLLFIASPLVQCRRSLDFRSNCLTMILVASVLLSVGSFFCYFMGINLFVRLGESYADVDVYKGSAGYFSGLTKHSMILGPIAGVSIIYLLHIIQNSRKFILLIPVLLCSGALLLSASRGAIISSIVSLVFFLYCLSDSLLIFIKRMFLVLSLLIVSFPIWQDAAVGVISKQETRSRSGGAFDSRTVKFDNRVKEFTSNPITGIGFASVDSNHRTDYDASSGIIEPGSSWLAVLSMTGLVGFSFFVYFILSALINCFKPVRKDLLLSTLLVFFLVHMLIEGYVFAGGNPVTFILWLIIARCTDLLTSY